MGKHQRCPCDGHDHSNSNGRKKKRLRNPKRACHCFAVSSIFRGIGRCMFVTCFPVMRCFGLDECRHRHHHHHHHRRHFHEFSWYWDWLCNIYFAGGGVWSFAAFFFLYLVSDPMRKNTNLGGKYGIRCASSINHHFVWFLCKYACQGRSRLQKNIQFTLYGWLHAPEIYFQGLVSNEEVNHARCFPGYPAEDQGWGPWGEEHV